ncbi:MULTISPECIES: peptide MFS transporter [unclassified Flavobacterium]|uniref:peptide MFS transporter n=1 Tax=unclassified Flavobacterium TaxID=196869 RepID=UPI00086C7030|nr:MULTISPECIES: peptide MFS transporter [unclassified Flavobacterium]MBN9283938.1 peptide MFS transporter [Flavobacterium sp.]ODS80987.1 MAG: amino acid transporter [Chryseobacterium sp. SCN 40-13]OJV73403.1 MAG: MFS transporter [Flavobacterium sp. 40-81]
MWNKHPKALPFLFLSEMWERFGYYLMIGIFTLYLKDVEAGFAMTEKEASDLYGTFIALVFLTPFIGGLVADRYLGYRKSIIIGGILMGIGYFLMGVHSITVLYIAMTLVILGNGFFKPNISTLLGNFYSKEEYKDKKDEGYNIFYMGINVGAFICNFFGAALQILLGWHWAFMAAGVGMFIGVLIFMSGTKHYVGYDQKKGVQEGDMPFWKIILFILVPSAVFGVIGWLLKGVASDTNPDSYIFGSDSTDAFIFACIPVVLFYASLYFKAKTEDKRPIAALLAIFGVVILFWAVFKLNGSALTTWADRYTDRQTTETTANVFNGLKLAKQVEFKKDSVELYDDQFRLQKENGVVKKEVNYPLYFRNVAPEKLPQEGSTVSLWATNLSQSINPGWVIILTPLVVAFFTFLRNRKKEPSTPTKIAFGLLISALSVLVMIAAVKMGNNGTEKVSVWWLVANYGIITIGELFLSPMGLSVVSKLSPTNITSLMMGGWFLATSIGNKLSGVLASMWDTYEDKTDFFWVNFSLLLVASLMMFVLLKWLNAIMKEKGIN